MPVSPLAKLFTCRKIALSDNQYDANHGKNRNTNRGASHETSEGLKSGKGDEAQRQQPLDTGASSVGSDAVVQTAHLPVFDHAAADVAAGRPLRQRRALRKKRLRSRCEIIRLSIWRRPNRSSLFIRHRYSCWRKPVFAFSTKVRVA